MVGTAEAEDCGDAVVVVGESSDVGGDVEVPVNAVCDCDPGVDMDVSPDCEGEAVDVAGEAEAADVPVGVESVVGREAETEEVAGGEEPGMVDDMNRCMGEWAVQEQS